MLLWRAADAIRRQQQHQQNSRSKRGKLQSQRRGWTIDMPHNIIECVRLALTDIIKQSVQIYGKHLPLCQELFSHSIESQEI